MNLKNIYLTTTWPQVPQILNDNNAEMQRALDVIYDETNGVIVVPVNTVGRVKAASGEFSTIVVDNLVVKNQYTNLYENTTTIDQDWYNTWAGPDISTSTRNASIGSAQEDGRFQYIDVNQPYYKVFYDVSLAFKCTNLGQVVGFIFDTSTARTIRFLLDPSTSNYISGQREVKFSANATNIISSFKLICISIDSSSGVCGWQIYSITSPGSAGMYTLTKI